MTQHSIPHPQEQANGFGPGSKVTQPRIDTLGLYRGIRNDANKEPEGSLPGRLSELIDQSNDANENEQTMKNHKSHEISRELEMSSSDRSPNVGTGLRFSSHVSDLVGRLNHHQESSSISPSQDPVPGLAPATDFLGQQHITSQLDDGEPISMAVRTSHALSLCNEGPGHATDNRSPFCSCATSECKHGSVTQSNDPARDQRGFQQKLAMQPITLHPLYNVERRWVIGQSDCQPTWSHPADPTGQPRLAPNRSVLQQGPNSTAFDVDRDANGVLLPVHLRPTTALTTLQQDCVQAGSDSAPCVAANLYTSPNRIERVIGVSSTNLKRKHAASRLPPTAHIYVRGNDPDFNIFSKGFLLYPELCFYLTMHMPLRDLVSLYAISRDFHTIIDSRFTTTCLARVLQRAPQSAQVFKFRTYAQFCRNDPAARLPNPDPTKAASNVPRRIPSFRWVAFVLHREKVVHELMTVFAERGCPLPARCSLALKKMWMLMDVPDNTRRIAMTHNHQLFTDMDLYFLMCFFIKLDMVANDPVGPDKQDGLRKLLLSQRRGLDTMLRVLKRELWHKRSDYLIAWVKTMMEIGSLAHDQLADMDMKTVFGVPIEYVGIGKYEFWGQKGVHDRESGRRRPYLLRPDQLVMRESIRRGVRFTKHFFRCVLYGYVRPDTLEDYKPREYGRRIADWGDEDYDIADGVGGVRALAGGDGGDPLLDLGNKHRGSLWTIKKETLSDQERAMRDGQAQFLKQLYAISNNEQDDRISRAHTANDSRS